MSSEQQLQFIVAGVQKAGTTALFEYLSKHPALAAPDQKELHFFNDESIDWSTPDYDKLHRPFRRAGFRFEVTPSYVFWPNAIARIWEYRPAMRLICLFRDPIERAFSHWCMEYGRGQETLSFQEAIRDGRQRLLGAGPQSPAFRYWSYVERGFYGEQVDRLLERFPLEQCMFLSSVDLDLAPRETLNKVTDFVGVDRFAKITPSRAHERAARAYPSVLESGDIETLGNLYSHDLARFAELTNIDVGRWLTTRGVKQQYLETRRWWS